jgi:hypothetical protein
MAETEQTALRLQPGQDDGQRAAQPCPRLQGLADARGPEEWEVRVGDFIGSAWF